MSKRILAPAAVVATAALVLTGTSPAFAATTTWSIANPSWWDDSNSWTGGLPAAGDDVVFAGGNHSYYNHGNVAFRSFDFQSDHRIQGVVGTPTLTDGVTVRSGAEGNLDITTRTSGSQTWIVEPGGTLILTAWMFPDPAATLTLDVDGVLEDRGNIDGTGTACVIKAGSGLMRFTGGLGGGVGSCGAGPEGLLVQEGVAEIAPGASLGGKAFAVNGGFLTGGSHASPGIVKQVNLVSGEVNPGTDANAVGLIQLAQGGTVWAGGTYATDLDADTALADLVETSQGITVSSTALAPRLSPGTSVPTTGDTFTVLTAQSGIGGSGFVSPAGTPLVHGDEFISDGYVYELVQDQTSVSVIWLRAAPVPPGPPAPPTPPEKVDTGSAGSATLGLSSPVLGHHRALERVTRS